MMMLEGTEEPTQYTPRAERVSFDLMVRYRFDGLRATVWLKNLNLFGARVEGLEGLRAGDRVTLYLPALTPKEARVVWTTDHDAAGLEFERPLHPDIFEELVLHHARARDRTDTDRLLQIQPRRETDEEGDEQPDGDGRTAADRPAITLRGVS